MTPSFLDFFTLCDLIISRAHRRFFPPLNYFLLTQHVLYCIRNPEGAFSVGRGLEYCTAWLGIKKKKVLFSSHIG